MGDLAFDDDVTVLSKISRISRLVCSIRQNHLEKEASILAEVSQIIGTIDDASASTIFGILNMMIRVLGDAPPNVNNIISALIGNSYSDIEGSSLISVLNSAIYALSTKHIVTNLQSLAETITIPPPFVFPPLFAHVINTLRYAALFLDDADIFAIKSVLGTSDDESTVYGTINTISHLISTTPAGFEAQLEELLEFSLSPETTSLCGRLSVVMTIISTKLANLLAVQKLREAVTPFFCKEVQDIELYETLVATIADVATDLANVNQTGEFFLASFDPKCTVIPLLNINKLASELLIQSKNFGEFAELIGVKFTFFGEDTLSSAVAELVDGFYLHPVRQSFEENIIRKLDLMWNDIAVLRVSPLKDSPYFGNNAFFDIESPNTLTRKAKLLQGALDRSFVGINHATAVALAGTIGMHPEQQNSLYYEICKIGEALPHEGVSPDDIENASQIILKAKPMIDQLMVLIHQSFFSNFFKTIHTDLKAASKTYGDMSFLSGLDIAVQHSGIGEVALFFEDDSYTLPNEIIIDCYGIMGSLRGSSTQTSLAGRVLSLTDAFTKDVDYMSRCVGDATDLRDSPYSSVKSTLYGNMNWILHQIRDKKICSCVHTGDLLQALSNEVLIFCDALDSLGDHLDTAISAHPMARYTDQALTSIANALNTISVQIEAIYQKNSAITDFTVQAYKINFSLQVLRNAFWTLTSNIQKILQQELPLRQINSPRMTDVTHFYQALDSVAVSVNMLSLQIRTFFNHLQNVQFLPVSSSSKEIIRSSQHALANIYGTLTNIRETANLAHHLNQNAAVESLIGYVQNIMESFNSLNDLAPLFDSHRNFLVSNIARLLTTIANAVSTSFADNNIEVDLFIRNRQIDSYMDAFVEMGGQISQAVRNLSNAEIAADTNVCIERNLAHITNKLSAGANLFIKLASDLLHTEILPIQKYTIVPNRQYDKFPIDEITASVNSLSQALLNVFQVVESSQTLAYHPLLINALQTFIGYVNGMHLEGSQSLEMLTQRLSQIVEPLMHPQCCVPLERVLFYIKDAIRNATLRFDSDMVSFSDTELLQIAGAINALHQKMRRIVPDFSKRLCFSDEIFPEVVEILDAVTYSHIGSTAPFPEIIHVQDEVFETATFLNLWSQKLHFLVEQTMDPQAIRYILDLAPFFSSVQHALSRLAGLFSEFPRKEFCSQGGKFLGPSVTLMARNLDKIVNEIHLLTDISNPVRAITQTQQTRQLITTNAHQHCLLGHDNVVYYRHRATPGLFILRIDTGAPTSHFTHGADAVIVNDEGIIASPPALAGGRIADFAPISLFTIVRQDADMLHRIHMMLQAYLVDLATHRK
jgi:hypothetical protein